MPIVIWNINNIEKLYKLVIYRWNIVLASMFGNHSVPGDLSRLSGVDCIKFITTLCMPTVPLFIHSSIELIFTSVPFSHEISPLCPAKFIVASRFYHDSMFATLFLFE